MRAFGTAAAILCLMFLPKPAQAQFVDAATDGELFAAYCVGALRSGHATEAEKTKIEGFRTYLAARGAFTVARSHLASQGLNVAVERGYADGVMCRVLRESCTKRCVNATEGSKEMSASCSDTCELSRCEKPDRCRTRNAIPF